MSHSFHLDTVEGSVEGSGSAVYARYAMLTVSVLPWVGTWNSLRVDIVAKWLSAVIDTRPHVDLHRTYMKAQTFVLRMSYRCSISVSTNLINISDVDVHVGRAEQSDP